MIEVEKDLEYEQQLLEYLQSRLPDKVYDAHFHINGRQGMARDENGVTPFEKFFNFTESVLGKGRLQGGLLMPSTSPEDVDKMNLLNLELCRTEGVEAGLLVAPWCGREKAERLLDQYPEICALKPYLTFMPREVMFESDILDFAPEWIWELANDRKMPVILHLSHYQNMLNEPKNYEQVKYLCTKYPHMKMVLAHCAMGHHIRKLRLGLEHIKHLDNIWFDCSGVTEAHSIYYCIRTFGVERMMYGGDYNHGASLGRICSYGSNFIAFHPGMVKNADCPRDYKYQPLNNLMEGLVSLFDAGDLLELTEDDYKKIFFENAKNVYCREDIKSL